MEERPMRAINMDAIACPHCGVSGAGNLNASSQIEYTGNVDGEAWISCPNCGSHVDFTEDATVTDGSGVEAMEWAVQIADAMDGVRLADASVNMGDS